MLHTYLTENGLEQNPADNCTQCVQKRKTAQKGFVLILIIWVDDLIVAASCEDVLNSGKRMLAERFKMKDLGRLNHFLGIDFNQTEGQVTMS